MFNESYAWNSKQFAGAPGAARVDPRDDPLVLRNMAKVAGDSMDRDFLLNLAQHIEEDYAHGFKLCPKCGEGHMIAVMIIDPQPGFRSAVELDSS